MTGLISAGGHEIEIREHYQVQEPPTEDDLPDPPPPDQATALTNDDQIDEFYTGMSEITSSGG